MTTKCIIKYPNKESKKENKQTKITQKEIVNLEEKDQVNELFRKLENQGYACSLKAKLVHSSLEETIETASKLDRIGIPYTVQLVLPTFTNFETFQQAATYIEHSGYGYTFDGRFSVNGDSRINVLKLDTRPDQFASQFTIKVKSKIESIQEIKHLLETLKEITAPTIKLNIKPMKHIDNLYNLLSCFNDDNLECTFTLKEGL